MWSELEVKKDTKFNKVKKKKKEIEQQMGRPKMTQKVRLTYKIRDWFDRQRSPFLLQLSHILHISICNYLRQYQTFSREGYSSIEQISF